MIKKQTDCFANYDLSVTVDEFLDDNDVYIDRYSRQAVENSDLFAVVKALVKEIIELQDRVDELEINAW